MTTKFDLDKEKYKKSLDKVRFEYQRFKIDHVKKTSEFTFEVFTEEPVELYIAVSDLIYQAIIIIDTSMRIERFKGKDRSFISGLKFVNNLIKHGTQNIEINEIMSSTPIMAGRSIKRKESMPFETEMQLESFWCEMPYWVIVDSENKNQKNKYDLYLKGKRVIDTVEKLDGIMKKYIAF